MYGPQQLAQIHARMTQGDIAGAVAAIETVIVAEPNNGQAWHLAGVIRRKSGNQPGARDAFTRAIGLGITSAELYNSLALTHEELGDFNAAEQTYADAMRVDGSYVPARVNAAKLLFVRDQPAAAIASLEATLSAFPGAELAVRALADIKHKTGDLDGAATLYDEALANNPLDMTATIRRGQILRDKGHSQDALDHLTRYAPKFINSPEFAEALSGPLVDLERFGEARQLLDRVVAAAPAYFPAHRALARLGKEYTNDPDPYASFRAIAEKWPKEVSIWQSWASTASAFRDYDLALSIIADGRRHIAKSPELAFLEAVALGEVGRARDAEALFGSLVEGVVSPRDYCAARARNAIRMSDGETAALWAQKALDNSPNDQFAWAYLGIAWRLLGDEREHWLYDYDVQTAQIPVPMMQSAGQLEEVIDALRKLHIASSNAAEQSMRNGTQTQGALFHRENPVIQELKASIATVVEEFVSGLPNDQAHPFYRRKSGRTRFVGSWSVRLKQSGYHISHIHPEGWISSALHLVIPEEGSTQADPNAGCLMLGAPPSELGLDLRPRKIVRPSPGALVLFPSMMWHGTVPFAQDSERLTVAFDAVPD